ncbi:MAG: hypothetical protein ACLQAH_06915 [Limisphaerales bacterium]
MTMVMRMPPVVLPAKSDRPDESRQRDYEKSAEINKDLRNGGSGWNQSPKRILFTNAKGAGQ